jgi:hypothetical protein
MRVVPFSLCFRRSQTTLPVDGAESEAPDWAARKWRAPGICVLMLVFVGLDVCIAEYLSIEPIDRAFISHPDI